MQSQKRPFKKGPIIAYLSFGIVFALCYFLIPEFKQGINLDRLPKTFRDAVYVARTFGIRYLWIDSLCEQLYSYFVVSAMQSIQSHTSRE